VEGSIVADNPVGFSHSAASERYLPKEGQIARFFLPAALKRAPRKTSWNWEVFLRADADINGGATERRLIALVTKFVSTKRGTAHGISI